MSHDEETLVRQRLFRLLDGRTGTAERLPGDDASAAASARTVTGASSDNGLDVTPAAAEVPGRLAGPGPFDPGRRGVRALAVVAVLVVVGAASWAWLSRPRTEPVASPPPSSTPVLSPAPSGSGGAEPGGTEVVVAVAGKVRRPGLVRLPAGARVADALQSAGGPLPGVDVALLNLARKVTDGELILVGVTPPPGAAPAGDTPAGAVGVPPGGGRVNLNTATLAQLDALPGVGPVLAQRIVAYREERGGFRSVADLRQVTGIGDARYEDLKDLVTV